MTRDLNAGDQSRQPDPNHKGRNVVAEEGPEWSVAEGNPSKE